MKKDAYDVYIVKCANKKLLVDIYNRETEENIRIDETYEDVKKLYKVLKEYFENGEIEKTEFEHKPGSLFRAYNGD